MESKILDKKEKSHRELLEGKKATVEDISRIVHRGKKLLSLRSIRRKRPRIIRKIYFYWIVTTNNNIHKMDTYD